jgi:hypothetical protein
MSLTTSTETKFNRMQGALLKERNRLLRTGHMTGANAIDELLDHRDSVVRLYDILTETFEKAAL